VRGSRPIRARLAIGAVALMVAVVATLGVTQVFSTRDSRRTDILNGELTAVRLASSAVASSISERLQLVTNLTSAPNFAKVFAPADTKVLPRVMAELHVLYPEFASFALINGSARLMARWPDDPSAIGRGVSSQPFYRNVVATKRAYVAAATQQSAAPHELVVALAAPILSATRPAQVEGILVATLSARSLRSLIGGTSLNGGGGLIVLDQAGHALSGPATGASHSYLNQPVVAAALAGRSGSATAVVPGFTMPRLAAYAPVPGVARWAVIAEFPTATLNGPISSLTERMVIIVLLVLLLGILTAWLVASLVQRLDHERERTEAVLASVGEGVATLDPLGAIRLVNPALESMLHVRESDVVGRNWSEAIPAYLPSGERIAWDDSLARRAIERDRVLTTTGYERELERPDGSRLFVSLTAAPLRAGNEMLGAVVVMRDVSREREVDRLKSSLVSTVSHELRTPLTMIQGFSELLLTRDDMSPDRSREALGQVHTSAQRLGRLIDDLLSVARIDAGKITVDLQPVELSPLFEELTHSFSHEPGGRIVIAPPEGVGPVIADRDKLFLVATNLISNAVKYSPPDTVVLVTAHTEGDMGVISVEDKGIGLSALELTAIFEKFARVDRPEVRRVGGTGLGLYITERLVAIQNGRLAVTSEPGRGSVFSVALPLASAAPTDPSMLDGQRRILEEAIDR
jgi:PAS domain S-box-containing protein